MTEQEWEPHGKLEEVLLYARAQDNQDRFLRRLARADLYLPVLAEELESGQGFNWVTSMIGGRRCVVAFTTPETLAHLMPDDQPYRVARFIEISRTWPDPGVWLGLNPGLPIAAYLAPDMLQELAALSSTADGELEEAMQQAIDAGDIEGFARALLGADVLLPIALGGSEVRDVTSPDFPWTRLPDERGTIVVYTAVNRLHEHLGTGREFVAMRFSDLAAGWPDPDVGLAVNPDSPFGGVVDGLVVNYLGERAQQLEEIADKAIETARSRIDLTEGQQFQLAQELVAAELGKLGISLPEPGRPAAVTAADVATPTGPAAPAGAPGAAGSNGSVPAELAGTSAAEHEPEEYDESGETGTAVQVVVIGAQLDRYLRQGHNRVAGLIHRRPSGAVPLADLYQRLGLLGQGSPFDADADAGYLLRWYESDPDAYQNPQMDGVEVRPGATLWRVDQAGKETCLAIYRPGAGWRRVSTSGKAR